MSRFLVWHSRAVHLAFVQTVKASNSHDQRLTRRRTGKYDTLFLLARLRSETIHAEICRRCEQPTRGEPFPRDAAVMRRISLSRLALLPPIFRVSALLRLNFSHQNQIQRLETASARCYSAREQTA